MPMTNVIGFLRSGLITAQEEWALPRVDRKEKITASSTSLLFSLFPLLLSGFFERQPYYDHHNRLCLTFLQFSCSQPINKKECENSAKTVRKQC